MRFELVTAWSLKLYYYFKEPSQLNSLSYYVTSQNMIYIIF